MANNYYNNNRDAGADIDMTYVFNVICSGLQQLRLLVVAVQHEQPELWDIAVTVVTMFLVVRVAVSLLRTLRKLVRAFVFFALFAFFVAFLLSDFQIAEISGKVAEISGKVVVAASFKAAHAMWRIIRNE